MHEQPPGALDDRRGVVVAPRARARDDDDEVGRRRRRAHRGARSAPGRRARSPTARASQPASRACATSISPFVSSSSPGRRVGAERRGPRRRSGSRSRAARAAPARATWPAAAAAARSTARSRCPSGSSSSVALTSSPIVRTCCHGAAAARTSGTPSSQCTCSRMTTASKPSGSGSPVSTTACAGSARGDVSVAPSVSADAHGDPVHRGRVVGRGGAQRPDGRGRHAAERVARAAARPPRAGGRRGTRASARAPRRRGRRGGRPPRQHGGYVRASGTSTRSIVWITPLVAKRSMAVLDQLRVLQRRRLVGEPERLGAASRCRRSSIVSGPEPSTAAESSVPGVDVVEQDSVICSTLKVARMASSASASDGSSSAPVRSATSFWNARSFGREDRELACRPTGRRRARWPAPRRRAGRSPCRCASGPSRLDAPTATSTIVPAGSAGSGRLLLRCGGVRRRIRARRRRPRGP